MWQMLKSEIEYNRTILMGLSVLIPIMIILKYYFTDISLMPFMMVFLLILVKLRVKEKRERQAMLLPVPIINIAFSRIMAVVLPTTILLIEIILLNHLTRYNNVVSIGLGFTISGLVLSAYSVFCVFYDLAVKRSKNNLRTAQVIIFILVLIPMIMGMVILLLTKKSPDLINQLTEIIKRVNPFSGPNGPIRFFFLSIFMACLSIWTFTKRKTYREQS